MRRLVTCRHWPSSAPSFGHRARVMDKADHRRMRRNRRIRSLPGRTRRRLCAGPCHRRTPAHRRLLHSRPCRDRATETSLPGEPTWRCLASAVASNSSSLPSESFVQLSRRPRSSRQPLPSQQRSSIRSDPETHAATAVAASGRGNRILNRHASVIAIAATVSLIAPSAPELACTSTAGGSSTSSPELKRHCVPVFGRLLPAS